MMVQERETVLIKLQNDIGRHESRLETIIETIKSEGVSNYPIIVANAEEFSLDVGIPTGLSSSDWTYKASTLEELYTKKMISSEKIDDFRALYNHKTAHFCVLLINPEGIEFVFIPFL